MYKNEQKCYHLIKLCVEKEEEEGKKSRLKK